MFEWGKNNSFATEKVARNNGRIITGIVGESGEGSLYSGFNKACLKKIGWSTTCFYYLSCMKIIFCLQLVDSGHFRMIWK